MTTQDRGFTRTELRPTLLANAVANLTGAHDAPVLVDCVWSDPGTGKSAFAADLHAEAAEIAAPVIGCKPEDIPFYKIMWPTIDPMDVVGLPVNVEVIRAGRKAEQQTMVFSRPDFIPGANDAAAFLFHDEVDKCSGPATQNMAATVMFERRAGTHALPGRVHQLAAGNLLTSRSGSMKLPKHMQNRMCHYIFRTDVDEVVAHFASKGHDRLLGSFLKDRANLLYTFKPNDEALAFATSRSWDDFGRRLKHLPRDQMHVWGAACVGDGPAAEFQAYSMLYWKLPKYDDLRAMKPDVAAHEIQKHGSSVMYAAIGMVAGGMKTAADVDWMVETFEAIAPDYCSAACNWLTNVEKKFALTLSSKAFQKYSATTGVAINRK